MTEPNKRGSHGKEAERNSATSELSLKGAGNRNSLSILPHSDFPLSLPLTKVRRQSNLCGGICQVCLALAQNRPVKGTEWIWKEKQKVTSPPAMSHMTPFILVESITI